MRSIIQRTGRIVAVAKAETLQLIRDRFTLSLFADRAGSAKSFCSVSPSISTRRISRLQLPAPTRKLLRPVVEQSGYFRIVGDGLAPGQAVLMVRTKQALIAVESTRGANDLPIIKLSADASDPAAIRPALLALQIAVWKKAGGVRAKLDVEWLYNENGNGAWAIAPGLIGVIVMITMLLLGALSLVRERERGTWESLLTAPLTSLDTLLGKLAPLLLFRTAADGDRPCPSAAVVRIASAGVGRGIFRGRIRFLRWRIC